MMLSEQAKAALERLRNSTDGVVDYYAIADEMLRLFPVKTLNGIVIRWDDEITPERLVASGFALEKKRDTITTYFSSHPIHIAGNVQCRLTMNQWWTIDDGTACEMSDIHKPTNMGEVWTLMAKCGCPVGGGE